MSHENNNENDDVGIFMRQDSVTSIYSPIPMTPTLTDNKSLLQTTMTPVSPKNHDDNLQMKRNISFGNLENRTEARVLCMYTGGTIGMLRNKKNGEQTNFHSC